MSPTWVTREISDIERRTVACVIEKCGFKESSLIEQIMSCRFVKPLNRYDTVIRFILETNVPPEESGNQFSGEFEAVGKDIDEAVVHVILYLQRGRIYEFEYLREDSVETKQRPPVEELDGFFISPWLTGMSPDSKTN